MSQAPRIPVTIIAGFLGAGKTTLVRRILDDPQGVRFGVLVNDFGAINIDALLVEGADQVALENGCVCCEIQEDLIRAVAGMLSRDMPPDRIVIEASGVSHPLPIVDALAHPMLADRVEVDGVFCLIDGAGFADLDTPDADLAIEQAADADIILLNKTDIADEAALASVEATLEQSMPRLRIVRTAHAAIPRGLLLGARSEALQRDDHHHAHDHGEMFAAWQWSSDRPVEARLLRQALREMPTTLLRVKGVLRDVEGRRLVLHVVGKRIELIRDDMPPPKTSAIVAIGRRGTFEPKDLDRIFATARAEM